MPAWLVSILGWILPLFLKAVTQIGLPAIEKEWPSLIPIINEIIKVLGGTPPSASLKTVSNHYNALVADAPTLKV